MAKIEKFTIRVSIPSEGKVGYIGKQTDINNIERDNLFIVDDKHLHTDVADEAKENIHSFFSKRKANAIAKEINDCVGDSDLVIDTVGMFFHNG